MSAPIPSKWDRLRTGRVRILWLVLGAMLLVSAVPIGLYHRQVLELSQEKLINTELVQQADLTRSLAREIELFQANLNQQLISERQIMALMGLSDNVEDPVAEPKVTRLLENFADSNRDTSSSPTKRHAIAPSDASPISPQAELPLPPRAAVPKSIAA